MKLKKKMKYKKKVHKNFVQIEILEYINIWEDVCYIINN